MVTQRKKRWNNKLDKKKVDDRKKRKTVDERCN